MFRKSFVTVSVLLFVLAATPLMAADQSTEATQLRARDRADWSSIVRVIKKAVRGIVKGNSDLLGGTKP